MAQAEPKQDDEVYTVDGINFYIEKEIADLIPGFQIDYHKGIFQRGYIVYAEGAKRSC